MDGHAGNGEARTSKYQGGAAVAPSLFADHTVSASHQWIRGRVPCIGAMRCRRASVQVMRPLSKEPSTARIMLVGGVSRVVEVGVPSSSSFTAATFCANVLLVPVAPIPQENGEIKDHVQAIDYKRGNVVRVSYETLGVANSRPHVAFLTQGVYKWYTTWIHLKKQKGDPR